MFTFQTLCLISALLASLVICKEHRLFAFTEIPNEICGLNSPELTEIHYANTLEELISHRSKIALLREPGSGRLWKADVNSMRRKSSCATPVNTSIIICKIVLFDIYLNFIDINNDFPITNGFGYHYLHVKSMRMETVAELKQGYIFKLKEVNNFQIKTTISIFPESDKPAIDSALMVAIPTIIKNYSCILLL
ncbi:hypothetical protein ACTXT7_007325 [Hymenolepis weldensis]